MEDYRAVLARLTEQLADIENNLGQPLSESANKYRITSETICKAVLIGHRQQPRSGLEQLIAQAANTLAQEENAREVSIFKAEIKYLQNIGNAFSHDGAGSGFVNGQDQSAAFDSLAKIVRISFFGEGDIDPPALPEAMERLFPARLLSRAQFENPRAEDVVHLCFPKNRIDTKISRADRSNRLVYDYVLADLGGELSKGMMFLRSRTTIERTLLDFHEQVGPNRPSALEIITPRVYRQDGHEIDRRKSILEIIKSTPLNDRGWNIHVKYFDDFVWESCLPESFRADGSLPQKPAHFIQQDLEPIGDAGGADEQIDASNYISNILAKPHEFNPVQIVIGPAGIGKTTFCDNISAYINSQERKRVIFLSATDFREISNSTSIESVSDLYRVAAIHGLIDEEFSIESHNFEINLACGNFVLLIDGFDELESHLGDSLNFEKFMRSLSDLEDCFRKVLVIMTVRDYHIDRFKQIRQASICRLLGFSNADTDRYLKDRLQPTMIGEAKRLLRSFNEDGEETQKTTVPLYASLICDHLVEETPGSGSSLIDSLDSSRFFLRNSPLDILVKKIVDREIAKQSLGKIHQDDFFEILIEIIRAPQLTITKAALVECVKACEGEENSINATNFMRNPFLRLSNDTISFKYDSLTHFFKSRYLARRIRDGQFSKSPSIEFMAEFCRGEGPLYDEIRSVFPSAANAESVNTLNWFRGLVKYELQSPDTALPWRKALSGFLYWALQECADKAERTNRINKYFDSNTWKGLSIFGRFYPLSLVGIEVYDGLIENYSQIQNCDFVPGKIVFRSGYVYFDDNSLPEKLERSIFSKECVFSPNLITSFQAKQMAGESSHEVIRDNLYKILKVGFKANRFVWKSKDVYRKVTVVGKFSLDSYLSLLVDRCVLILEPKKSGSDVGYIVSESWHADVRKLVEEKNLTSKVSALVSALPKVIS